MEKELNIAAILNDKPNIKVWSDAFGELTLKAIRDNKEYPILLLARGNYDIELTNEGYYFPNMAGVLPCIVPSKEMRSWEKFTWKKGDVLASNNVICVFGGFRNDDYTKFNALNAICISPYDNKNVAICSTTDFSKVESEKDIKNYLLNSQVIFGNIKLPVYDIEQSKQKFKDGDIVFAKCEEENKADYIVICK